MRVLHLISSGGQYGAENVVLELASSLESLGCAPTVGVFENRHRPNTEVLEAAKHRGLSTLLIPCEGRFDLQPIAQIREFLRQHAVDVVHTHGYKSNFYGFWAARSERIPIVATCHGWPGKSLALRIYYGLDRLLLRRFDGIFVVSDATADALRRVGIAEERIRKVDNGIDVTRFTNCKVEQQDGSRPPSPMRVGFVGRLAPEKGVNYLLRACQGVMGEFPEIELHLVGEGREHENLQALATELGIADKVIFRGYSVDMSRVLAELDMFVLPSTSEGMPLALLEAMAAGKAVVASRVGSIPSVVLPGKTGQLTAPGNVDELRDALLLYLRNPRFAHEMGENAAQLVRTHYSASAMGQRYLAGYDRVSRDKRMNAAQFQHDA